VSEACGFAVVQKGKIMIETVGPTDISAMVNWLCASHSFLMPSGVPDSYVRRAFRQAAEPKSAEVVRVNVVEAGRRPASPPVPRGPTVAQPEADEGEYN
jgi:hypothetical protein